MADIDLCNQALTSLGVREQITSLSGTDRVSQLCNSMYDRLRKWLLINYKWPFATTLVTLDTPSATLPAWGFGNAFDLPVDYLKLIKTSNPYTDYEIVGTQIYTNESSINIKYIRDVDDTDEMAPLFQECFVALLAAELSFPLIKDRNLQMDKRNEFKEKVREARSLAAQEGNDGIDQVDTWLDSRLGDYFTGPNDRSYFWY